MRLLRTLGLLLAFAMIAAACGSDDDGGLGFLFKSGVLGRVGR